MMRSRTPTPTSPALCAPTPSPTPTSSTMSAVPSRRRALRTYGKKRPLRGNEVQEQNKEGKESKESKEQEDKEDVDMMDTTEPSPKKQKRAGILRYFQPAPLPRSSASSASSCSLGTPPTSPSQAASPPPSPPPSRRRQKRRLTMRLDTAGEKRSCQEQERVETTEPPPQAEQTGGMPASSMRMRARMRGQTPSAQPAIRKAETQTTLSLTVGGDTIKECRECNILYNPLHEKDARLHARYHAAAQRKRQKQDA